MFSFRNTFVSLRTFALGALALAGAAPAQGALTQLRTTPHASEQNQAQIFSHTFGGSCAASGSGFTNGAVTATRIDDLSDVAWSGGKLTVTPIASFAGSSATLGLLSGKSGGSYQSLFTVNQFGYVPSPASTTIDLAGKPFRFTLDNGGTNLRSSSLASENATGDQLITYRIDGLGDCKSRYLLFWEDVPVSDSDRDYNDLVVAATFNGRGGPVAVPLPPAALAGGAVMAGAAMLMYWKRRQAIRIA